MKHHHFNILETMKMEDGKIPLWSFHKERLEVACRHFNYPITHWETLWDDKQGNHKVRLLVGKDASAVEFHTLPDKPIEKVTIDVMHTETNEFTKYKTTHRYLYVQALDRHPSYDDVILWNQDDFVLETTLSNIILEGKDGKWYTPDFSFGQLIGVYLKYLMTTREIIQAKILYSDLHNYKIYCCNAVRGVYEVTLE